MRVILLAAGMIVAGSILSSPSAAKVYYTTTQTITAGGADFTGSFTDATPYPSSVVPRTYRVTVSGGTIETIDWTFDQQQAALWWEHFAPDEPFFNNGNEYNFPTACSVAAGGRCDSGGFGTIALSGNVGRVTQTTSPRGFNDCAAVLPGLIAANFIGISANCAESYTALHSFDAFVSGAGPVTLTVASVPEPTTWTLLIAGFALTGIAARIRQRVPTRRAAP